MAALRLPLVTMSVRDKEKEKEIDRLEDIATLKRLRGSRKGQITKVKNDLLLKCQGVSIVSIKKMVLESLFLALETQYHFYTLIQDRILSLLSSRSEEASVCEEEEAEGDEQLQVTLDLRQQLKDYLKAIDIYSKAKRIQLKFKMFIDSDSLADRDMNSNIKAMGTIVDELLDACIELPDMNELTELIGEVHLSYHKFIRDVLRTTPVGVSDSTPATSSTCSGHKPLYGLPKTEMPTYDGDPKLWRKFWERFNQRISMHPDLPASEKIAQLEQAIKPLDGKALISAPKGSEAEYQTCVVALKQRYDQPRKIYRTYVHDTYEHFTPYTRKGFYTLSSRLQDAMNWNFMEAWMQGQ